VIDYKQEDNRAKGYVTKRISWVKYVSTNSLLPTRTKDKDKNKDKDKDKDKETESG
jgi:hypothetical protein